MSRRQIYKLPLALALPLLFACPSTPEDDDAGVTTNASDSSADSSEGSDSLTTTAADTTTTETDSSTTETDSSTIETDSSTTETDSSSSETDSSTTEADSSSESSSSESSDSSGEDGECDPNFKLDLPPDPDPPLPDACTVAPLDWVELADFPGCNLCDDLMSGCAFVPYLACATPGPGETCADLCPSGNCAGFNWGICEGELQVWDSEPVDWCGHYEIDGQCCTVGKITLLCAE